MEITRAQVNAAVQVVLAVGDAIREAGPAGIPSGHLYAALMGHVTLEGYTNCLDTLKAAGLIREANHCLFWTGPTPAGVRES